MEKLEVVESSDGVSIARWISGQGPNLVLVHGTGADHTRWRTVAGAFEEHFTVCAIDRRGRGGSGDAASYSPHLEFEDIAAVCERLDSPVYLLGHSYGAVCSLGAARLARKVEKLVLYEPPFPVGDIRSPADFADRLVRLAEQGDREGVLLIFFREVAGLSDAELEGLRADPSWVGRLAAAHTIPREYDVHLPDVASFGDVQTPTLLLLGGESPHFFRAAIDTLAATLPHNQVVLMPGQQHVAMNTAPELFVREVVRFLKNGST